MTIRVDDRVAIITGAGGGLGRCHALLLASRGAKVVINDFGGTRDGSGASSSPAEMVAAEIRAAGGEAMANSASVTDYPAVEAMVEEAIAKWGRVDILVNNAGVLRDKSFAKMEIEDFRFVVEVHLMGAFNCTKAVWNHMRERNYGRIVMTTSSSGLFGNFGQSNYGAAKAGMVGLMQTLAIEGSRNNIRVNALAPTAATRMTEDIMSEEVLKMFIPEAVSPGLLYLVSDEAPTRRIICAGAGSFAAAHLTLTKGGFIGWDADAPERIIEQADKLFSREGDNVPEAAVAQARQEVGNLAKR